MKVGVIGAGVMGRGIAQVSAMAGHSVVLFDINHEMIEVAQKAIDSNLKKAIDLKKITTEEKEATQERIQFSNSIADVNVDLVIEAIVEKIDVKIGRAHV